MHHDLWQHVNSRLLWQILPLELTLISVVDNDFGFYFRSQTAPLYLIQKQPGRNLPQVDHSRT
jgi:hypothetical protein